MGAGILEMNDKHGAAAARCGAAAADITPTDSQFLFGYPHVKRYSTGVHDRLLSSALYIDDGRNKAMFIANDIIYVPQAVVGRARKRIEQAAGVDGACIMISATHTHSGPKTVNHLSNANDPVIPPADTKYLQLLEDGIVSAAVAAVASAQPAQLAMVTADGSGLGTNRHDPAGPADPQMPVLLVRRTDDKSHIAAMIVCSMHPTVLHEDSTLVSGDFPAMARQALGQGALGSDCVILHHMGPAGNQSPRHVTRENTFAEARRLGGILAAAVEKALATGPRYVQDIRVKASREHVDLPRRKFLSVADAQAKLDGAVRRLADLRNAGAPRTEVRTAECDWFGAEETLALAAAACDGRLEAAYKDLLPVEVQVIAVGGWVFAGWPCEAFVEYALEVKAAQAGACVISAANGELQGYIVTPEAASKGGYEASNTLFDCASGRVLVDTTLALIAQVRS